MAKFIWFSGATDVTGQALADALGLTGVKSRPRNLQSGDIIIGWGIKTSEDVSLNSNAHVLNHPNKIRANRNKFKALEKMVSKNNLASSIAKFCLAQNVVQELNKRHPEIKLPLVGRTNYHQSGKKFWLCLTKKHVQKAINDGAQYFQNYVSIDTEYRLHVAFGGVIYAQKKIENATKDGWKNQRKEKVLNYSNKNNWNLDETAVERILGVLVEEVTLPDRIVRSNKRGWKFSSVRLDNVSNSLKTVALAAVEALGLDFGAVDCALGEDGNPYIIEVNSAPGLQGTALEKYVETLSAKINSIENPAGRAVERAAVKKPGRVLQAGANANADEISDQSLVLMMNAVKTPEDATNLLVALRGRL